MEIAEDMFVNVCIFMVGITKQPVDSLRTTWHCLLNVVGEQHMPTFRHKICNIYVPVIFTKK